MTPETVILQAGYAAICSPDGREIWRHWRSLMKFGNERRGVGALDPATVGQVKMWCKSPPHPDESPSHLLRPSDSSHGRLSHVCAVTIRFLPKRVKGNRCLRGPAGRVTSRGGKRGHTVDRDSLRTPMGFQAKTDTEDPPKTY